MLWLSKQVKEFKDSDCYYFFRHKYHDIKRYVHHIKRWFSWYKPLKQAYEWDYTSILSLEREQIRRVRDCIDKEKLYEGYEYDVQRMNLALKLLDIILGDCGVIKFTGSESIDLNNLNARWEIVRYVNTNNAHRFLKPIAVEHLKDPKHTAILTESLYEEKTWQLYYKLRTRYTRRWWD